MRLNDGEGALAITTACRERNYPLAEQLAKELEDPAATCVALAIMVNRVVVGLCNVTGSSPKVVLAEWFRQMQLDPRWMPGADEDRPRT